MRRSSLAAAVLCASCAPSGTQGLAATAKNTSLVLEPQPALAVSDSNPVFLSIERTNTFSPSDCAVVSGQAFIDGAALDQIDTGGNQLGFDGAEGCHSPFFALSALAAPDVIQSQPFPSDELQVKVEVQDDTGMWRMTVVAPFDQRRLSLVAPANGMLHGGDTVVLAYSPPTDVLSNVVVTFAPDDPASDAGFSTANGAVTVSPGDQLSFTVPSGLPAAAGSLSIAAAASAGIVACTGPASCAAPLALPVLTVPVATAD